MVKDLYTIENFFEGDDFLGDNNFENTFLNSSIIFFYLDTYIKNTCTWVTYFKIAYSIIIS